MSDGECTKVFLAGGFCVYTLITNFIHSLNQNFIKT